jgi:hypothetical protein
VDRRHLHAGRLSESAEAAGGGVPVHPGAAAIEQDRSAGAVSDGPVEGAADGRRERDEDGPAAFAGDT